MSKDNKIVVGITQGDSNGIGYEVIIKALSDERILDQFTPVVYGSPKLFGFYCKTIPEIEHLNTKIITQASTKQKDKHSGLSIRERFRRAWNSYTYRGPECHNLP